MGYDTKHETYIAIKIHSDGSRWLHTGDIGYISEVGTVYALTRGSAPIFGAEDLATRPIENLLADADIPGIDDEFFVIIPDPEHHLCFVPYLFLCFLTDTLLTIYAISSPTALRIISSQ